MKRSRIAAAADLISCLAAAHLQSAAYSVSRLSLTQLQCTSGQLLYAAVTL
jgi:hypothetical protein